MKVAFDTSVLVAGSVLGHAHAARAAVWLDAARQGRLEAVATSHAFSEAWATLTSLPIEPRLPAVSAGRLIDHLARHVAPQPLTWEDYRTAFGRCGDHGLRSGAVYDALHLVAAERVGAGLLLSFNTRHFERLARAGGPRILAPPDPPGLGGVLGEGSDTGPG